METSEQRIKIAVQKTGRLTDHSIDLLERCGLKITKSKDQLICYGENMPIDLLLVRDDDIPGLVSEDVCDLGIVGLNVVEEKRHTRKAEGRSAEFKQVFELDFGHCRLSIAGPEDGQFTGPKSLENTRIATSYVGLLTEYLKKNNINAETVYFSGAVEIAPKLGRADFICDLVSTGSTLKAIRPGSPLGLKSRRWLTRSSSASMAFCRFARANTSCCMRQSRRLPRYATSSPGRRPQQYFASTAATTR
jgi:ATP phosphoribosyltransferase